MGEAIMIGPEAVQGASSAVQQDMKQWGETGVRGAVALEAV